MSDLLTTVVAKSEFMTSEDLLSGPRTFTVEKIHIAEDGSHYSIKFLEWEKPYLPCKTVRRVLMACWGDSSKDYPGRQVTLYRDPEVVYGGQKVGGIRISHASHITEEKTVMLMVGQGKKSPYKVMPLQTVDIQAIVALAEKAASKGVAAYSKHLEECSPSDKVYLKKEHARLSKIAKAADAEQDEEVPV